MNNNIYTIQIQKAIRFSLKTHEIYQKQKRKAKDTPYIMHPMTVALIISRVSDDEDLVIAGILHDTIEDSLSEKPVFYEMILERFGEKVAMLVASVTEQDKSMDWIKRKDEAINHISSFDNNSCILKSADIIANGAELFEDYASFGDDVFRHFHASKELIIENYLRVIAALLKQYPENPLADDLTTLQKHFLVLNKYAD